MKKNWVNNFKQIFRWNYVIHCKLKYLFVYRTLSRSVALSLSRSVALSVSLCPPGFRLAWQQTNERTNSVYLCAIQIFTLRCAGNACKNALRTFLHNMMMLADSFGSSVGRLVLVRFKITYQSKSKQQTKTLSAQMWYALKLPTRNRTSKSQQLSVDVRAFLCMCVPN